MASAPTSAPPKFVPTLTEEVELPADSPDPAALADPVEVPGGYELPAGAADDDEVSALEPPVDVNAIPELDAVVEVEEPPRNLASIPEISDVVTDAEIVSTVADPVAEAAE